MTRVSARAARAAVPGQLGALGPVRISEKDFQSQVRDLARRFGWDLVFHAMQPFHAAERGWPDLVLVRTRDRRLIFAELKAESGKLSDRQVEVLDMLRSVEFTPPPVRGVGTGTSSSSIVWSTDRIDGPRIQVFVWRPSDYDAVLETLR